MVKITNKTKLKKWNLAEDMFGYLQAERMMPLFGGEQSDEDYLVALKDICKKCHFFYPALFEIGFLMLKVGDDLTGKKYMDKGIEFMLEYSEENNIEEEGDILLDNFLKFLRYDLAKVYALKLIEKYPDISIFYDTLAQCEAILGNEKVAIETIDSAIELKPESNFYHSSKGWFHLIFGNLDLAEDSLLQSLELSKDNTVARNNLKLLYYLRQNGGNYFDYLLRPFSHELSDIFDEEGENDDDDDYDEDYSWSRLHAGYNHDRIEALKMLLPARDIKLKGGLADIISTLEAFFRFVRDNIATNFLYEDIVLLEEDFLSIMHAFIVRFKDADAALINDIYEGFTIFYSFLNERGIVKDVNFQNLIEIMSNEKKGLIAKTNRYKAERSRPDITEEEKKALCKELFNLDDFYC